MTEQDLAKRSSDRGPQLKFYWLTSATNPLGSHFSFTITPPGSASEAFIWRIYSSRRPPENTVSASRF